MKLTGSKRTRHAFTLIEIVIGAALMSLILVAAYLCLNAGFSSQKIIEPRAGIIQNARVAMAFITADLRGACSLSKDNAFLGVQRTMGEMEGDSIDFGTHNYTPRRPGQGDYCQESIFVDRNQETGQFSVWRRRNPALAIDPLSGGSREEIATGVLGLRFEYFDGLDWYTTWGELKSGKKETTRREQSNLEGLPSAVRVTLLLDSNPKSKAVSATGERVVEPPLVFQTVVSLELAENEMNQPSSGPSNATDSDPNNPQGSPNGGNF